MASPLDSIYGAGAARLLYQNKRQRDEIAQEGARDTEDFNTMLQRLARQRSDTLHATNHGANREGLFYSGQLGKRRGEVERQFSERERDARTDRDRRVSARAQALQDLGSITAAPGSPLGYAGTGRAAFDLADLFNDAVGRQLERDAASQLNTPGEPAAPAPAAVRVPAERTMFSRKHGRRMVYRHNSNGTWTPIRPA